jgi:hypothetical protein
MLRKCLVLNAVLLVTCISIVCRESKSTPYLRFGPNESLVLLGVPIDTWHKYYVCNVLIAAMQCVDMIINDLAMPVLNFTIFNPDKKIITEFGKNELQVYAQLMWIMNSLRSTFMVLVTISQIDIALFKIISGELASCVSVRILLNQKEFCSLNLGNR